MTHDRMRMTEMKYEKKSYHLSHSHFLTLPQIWLPQRSTLYTYIYSL